MRYVLRADASESIGSGHVMRVSAIAEELIARGADVAFVGLIEGLPWVTERITSLGFRSVCTEPRNFISNPSSDSLILDSYQIPVEDWFLAEENWLNIIAIVDESTPNYRCSLRIHPSLESIWVGNSITPILIGPKYIPLRSSLSGLVPESNHESHKLQIALVAGGSDPHGVVPEVAKILAGFSESFDAHMFSNYPAEGTLDSRFQQHGIGLHLDELTKNVDLVLTTSSTSSLEFLARGHCVGIICAVENQRQYYDSLGRLGVAAKIGIRDLQNNWSFDHEKIQLLITSRVMREALKDRAKNLIDFKGSSRIVDAILSI